MQRPDIPFRTIYRTVEEVEAVLLTATKPEDVDSLDFCNRGLIMDNPDLQKKVRKRKSDLYNRTFQKH